MQTILSTLELHPELARYVASYDQYIERDGGGAFAEFLEEVNVVASSLEAFYRLGESPWRALSRETILTDAGGEVQGHFIHCDEARAVYFVPGQIADELIPQLRADGGGCSTLGTVEHWTI